MNAIDTYKPSELTVAELAALDIDLTKLSARRRFIIGAGGLVVGAALGACGADEQMSAPAVTTEGTRTVDTPRGSINIPADPQRVVTIHPFDLANALVLGLPVIAGPGLGGQPDAPFSPYLVEAFGEQLDGVTRIAFVPQVNLEQIANLRPDVILAGLFAGAADDPMFDHFDAIAPTVTYQYSEGAENAVVPWQTMLQQNSVQFGRQATAEGYIAQFEQRAANLREQLAPHWAGKTYAIVEPYIDQPWVYGSNGGHMANTLQDELGLMLSESVGRLVATASEGGSFGASISYERLDAVDADVIFVMVRTGANGTPDHDGIEVLTAQALWARLPAVRAGRVYEFANDILYESGPTAMAFLDVVEQALLG